MRLLSRAKDGGPASTVTGYWLIELKRLISVVLLCFSNGSRDEYHDHAFSSVSWVLWGALIEEHLDGRIEVHMPSLWPVITRRDTFHRVISLGTTWVFSLRGPWARLWHEHDPRTGRYTTLAHGRREVTDAV